MKHVEVLLAHKAKLSGREMIYFLGMPTRDEAKEPESVTLAKFQFGGISFVFFPLPPSPLFSLLPASFSFVTSPLCHIIYIFL